MKTTTCLNGSKQTHIQHDCAGNGPIGLLLGLVLTLGLAVPLRAQETVELAITNSVLLSWPEPTNDCIVIAASSPTSNAVWTPWPEPIFQRFGELCMSVPTINTQQFFKLAVGSQFVDDFNSASQWPWATRGGWVPYFTGAGDRTRFVVTNMDGALQLRTIATPVDQLVVMPPGPDVLVADFWASIDILDWGAGTNERSLGIFARGAIDRANFPLNSDGYIGELWLNHAGNVGKALLNIFADGDSPGQPFDLEAGKVHRLVFCGTGRQLTLKLFKRDVTWQLVAERSRASSLFAHGPVCLFIGNYARGPYDFTIDNVFVTGTKP